MGNIVFGYNFLDYTATPSTADTDFGIANIEIYDRPKKNFRTTVITESNVVFNYAAAKSIKAIVLADVNFAECYIQANSSSSWGAPPYRYPAAGNLTVSKDSQNQRYSVYIPAVFSYQYSRLVIPAQTPIDGLSYFRVGSSPHLDTIMTLNQNPKWPYGRSGDEKSASLDFEGGGFENVNLGDLIWEGSFGFEGMIENEEQLWTLNALGKAANLVLYENMGDTSKVRVCRRRTPLKMDWDSLSTFAASTQTFRELR